MTVPSSLWSKPAGLPDSKALYPLSCRGEVLPSGMLGVLAVLKSFCRNVAALESSVITLPPSVL